MSPPQPIADDSKFGAALTDLGVHAGLLTEVQRTALDRDGYAMFPGLIDSGWLTELRTTFDSLAERESGSAGHEVHQEAGTRRLSDLVNKSPAFDRLYTHPTLLAAIHHVLRRPFKLSSLNARDALAGHGLQGLHADWGKPHDGATFHVANSLWLLDDYTADNGCTRLVPGSHRRAGAIGDHVDDPTSPHAQEVRVVAPAGTVVVFNSHVWHGGTRNDSGARRRVCHCYFTARQHPQQLEQAAYLRVRTWQRLSPAARYLLDVDGLMRE